MNKYILPALLFSFLFVGCSSNPYKATNKVYRQQAKALMKPLQEVPVPVSYQGKVPEFAIGTVNFNLRKPNYVIIHHTAQNACEQTVKAFINSKSQVSAHYVICKDGTVHHLLNDYMRAWHAGVAKWGSVTDINSISLGIELDNNGKEPFPDVQIQSLVQLLSMLKRSYNIPPANFIGHSDIAPGRKVDPSNFFPWKKLAEGGFGLWPDMITDTVPKNFNSVQALRIIGYDTKDSIAAIKAFKLHFNPVNSSATLSDADKSILNNLYKKY